MSHPAGKRRHIFKPAGYNPGDMNDPLERRAKNKGEAALRAGAKYFEYQGMLLVLADGQFEFWETVDPKRIGRN